MAEYKITIERKTMNTEYAQEMDKWRNRGGFEQKMEPPNLYVAVKVLETVLTEEEFQRARNAILQAL